ncbi:MAG: SDR family oxidoreductase [Armatimonadetes bacterium]|nr:SDR family oxidoreductase [Armatimonadota bacterium]
MIDAGLKGKKALITGGGVGIGLAVARYLAEQGVDIAIANRGDYPEAVGEITSLGVKAIGIRADMSKEEDVVRMVKEAVAGLGGLDLYVNNVAAHWDEPTMKVTSEGWMNTVNTNLSACVYACREVGRHFIENGRGSILIIASTATYTLCPGEFAYRTTKTALVPYMECLAAELAPFGIRVNMLTPGLFITRMTEGLYHEEEFLQKVLAEIPFRKPGDAYADIGPAAALLLSDKLSSYTTGANLVIDGGIKMRVLPWRSDEEVRQMNT